MARKYRKSAGRRVKKTMHEMKRGKLRSGRSGKQVKSRRQAIAIGLSEARREGKKVPRKKTGRRAKRAKRKSSYLDPSRRSQGAGNPSRRIPRGRSGPRQLIPFRC